MQRLKDYHMVMTEQLAEGSSEEVPKTPMGEVIHYIPHQPVIQGQADSTKMRIV